MTRPAAHRWEVLGESSDPVPGDPEDVAKLGRELRRTADAIERQAGEIKALASVENWKGKAADAFREAAGGAEGRLRKAFRRYDEASQALGTRVVENVCSDEYASELHRAQQMADQALAEAEAAEEDETSARKALDAQPDDAPAEDPDARRLRERKENAVAALNRAKEALSAAKGIRDRAAKAAADAIEDVIENDGLKDSRWDKFKNWVSENTSWIGEISKWAGRIAAVAGIAALLVGWIPFIGQALAAALGTIAMIATAVSLIANLTLALAGEGSWFDVAVDVVGLATFGIGRAAVLGAKGAVSGTKALARSRLFQKAVASGVKQSKAWKAANAGSRGAPRGKAASEAMRTMPSGAFPGWRRVGDAFHPGNVARDSVDSFKGLKALRDTPKVFDPGLRQAAAHGPLPSAASLADPGLSRMANDLRSMAPAVLTDDGIRAGLSTLDTQTKIFAGATGLGTGAGVSNANGVDAWNATGIKEATTAEVGN